MKDRYGISRRDFFKIAGGGIAFLFCAQPGQSSAQEFKPAYPDDFNAYLLIGANGRVTVFSGKIEMGQGVLTSQAQMVAEELGVDISAIDMVLGDTDRCPWDMGTFGSLTTRMFGPALRAAASEAKSTLLAMAAQHLGVPADALIAQSGAAVVREAPERRMSFGALAKGKRLAYTVKPRAALHGAADFNVIGQSPPRLDGIEKVTGAARYAADVRLAGMLYARILRPPRHGARLDRADTKTAESVAGVRIVRSHGLIAALHADPERAGLALSRIKAKWDVRESDVDQDKIFERLARSKGTAKTVAEAGSREQGLACAAQRFKAEYWKGYVAHAPIEPHAALADVRSGRAVVWASTQTPFPTRDRVAHALGFAAKDVRVITPFVGGGFGGKSAGAQAVEAALLSAAVGKPVQVMWTRAEEFFFDTFDPAAVVEVESAIDRDGKICLWNYAVHAAGERGAAPLYEVPNVRVSTLGRGLSGPDGAADVLHPFAVGPWRAPGANMNVFARESQIDLMAAAAKIDPVEFRMRNLSDARMRRVLRAAADRFGWTAAAAPSKRGFGVACSVDAGTYVAAIAEVAVDAATGKVRVARIVCAQDMGIVVNPAGAAMQIEGGLTMGLGYALAEELRFRGRNILDRNFGTYRIPRFSDAPRIDAVLVRNDALPPQGGGEPAITCTGAVIANAVYDATGVRMFRLPITPDRLLNALRAA